MREDKSLLISYLEQQKMDDSLIHDICLLWNRKRGGTGSGIHANCLLHDTKGILQGLVIINNQYRFNQLRFEKNRVYYYSNTRIIKRNIKALADTLKKALVLRSQENLCRSTSGQLAPARL